MPVYNGEKYLNEAIDSILNQTFSDFEFLIINDGSTDNTNNIILSYSDPRIRYIKNERNLKLIATLNKGLDLAQGKYIARMDADDISLSDRLEKQIQYMEKNPNIGLLGSWVNNFDVDNEFIVKFKSGHKYIRFELFFKNYIHHPTVMLRAEIFRNEKIYYPDVLHAEDYALWIKLAEYTEFDILPEVLLKYRSHGENISEINKNIQKKHTAHCRCIQLKSLGIKVDPIDFKVYENFIDNSNINNPKKFSNLMCLISSIIEANSKNKLIDSDLLIHYFGKKLNEYVEQNCWNMGKELDVYLNSIFCPNQKQKLKLKLKQKLGIKKLWN